VAEHLRRIAGVERDVTLIAASGDRKGVADSTSLCGQRGGPTLSASGAFARSHRDRPLLDRESPPSRPPSPRRGTGPRRLNFEVSARASPSPSFVATPIAGHSTRSVRLRGEPLEPSTQSRVDVNGHVFSVGPRSFWQSHRDRARAVARHRPLVRRRQGGEHVADLFSGVGLFAVPMGKAVGPGGRVTAVESSPYAVRDARQNAEGFRNVKVREWSVTPRAVNDSVGEGDVVVMDPPRGGLAKGVAEALVRRRPRREWSTCRATRRPLPETSRSCFAGGYEIERIAQCLTSFP
jgi:tRNA/tmRNA/rRNA uracil-C5-methylase (TrmA/RlmC/RlmD family)